MNTAPQKCRKKSLVEDRWDRARRSCVPVITLPVCECAYLVIWRHAFYRLTLLIQPECGLFVDLNKHSAYLELLVRSEVDANSSCIHANRINHGLED